MSPQGKVPSSRLARGVGVVAALAAGMAASFALGSSASGGSADTTTTATTATQKPVVVPQPSVSGTPREGETLTVHNGNWSGAQPITFAHQWQRCDSAGCHEIYAANAQTHTLTAADVGDTMRVVITATNQYGGTLAITPQTAVVSAAAPHRPQNTYPPTVSGTPQEGQQLTGDKGTWTNNPTDFNYFWLRCDRNGGSCADISGAHAATYTLTSADVGNTLRFRVQASNAAGSTFAHSVPSAVIRAAPPPPPPPPAPAPTGCPAGTGPITINDLTPPARLLIDGQQTDPTVVHTGAQQIIVRYHVSACGGRAVQGALVYSTAVPFNQLSIPPEQPTGPDGWAELRFQTLTGFPASPRQQLIALFARARKPGENLLAGISTRRLFSLQVDLRG